METLKAKELLLKENSTSISKDSQGVLVLSKMLFSDRNIRTSGGSRPLRDSSRVTVLCCYCTLLVIMTLLFTVNNAQLQESLPQKNPPQNTH